MAVAVGEAWGLSSLERFCTLLMVPLVELVCCYLDLHESSRFSIQPKLLRFTAVVVKNVRIVIGGKTGHYCVEDHHWRLAIQHHCKSINTLLWTSACHDQEAWTEVLVFAIGFAANVPKRVLVFLFTILLILSSLFHPRKVRKTKEQMFKISLKRHLTLLPLTLTG